GPAAADGLRAARPGQRDAPARDDRDLGPAAADRDPQRPALPVHGVERDAGELRRQARVERDLVAAPAHAAVAVEELLQEAAGPRGEGEGAAGAGLGELVEGPAHE